MNLGSINWGMILGGFGMFMFGIKFMGDGLKAAAGDKLRDYINRYTSNPVSALLIGILLTIILQSSSATTAITIGLVRAGLMTLEQAAGIVLGANIGTTVTSFLISINIERYAMFIVFFGAMFICFAKKQKLIHTGEIVLGFGLIFFGMATMGDALAALKNLPWFENFALSMAENPIMALLAGVGLTAAVQSSAATIGVAQKLYQAGAITFSAALPFMFGANIGTTMTGILASIGGSTAGKRTAGVHTVLNIIATVAGMLLLKPFSAFIQSIAGNTNPMMQIAIANIVFKFITTIIFLPFTKQLVAFVRRIIPGTEVSTTDIDIDEMDTEISTLLPSAALDASQNAILKMLDLVRLNIVHTQELFKGGKVNAELVDMVDRNESTINKFDHKITEYLIKLFSQHHLTVNDKEDNRLQLDTVKNLERIGDLATNLSEFYNTVYENKGTFTSYAQVEVNQMYDKLIDMFDLTAEVFVTKDHERYKRLSAMEEEMDALEMANRNAHFERMANHLCTSAIAESEYCDILGTIERMADHCMNIARVALTGYTDEIVKHEL